MNAKKKRIPIGSIFRRIIQLLTFILLPGLFINTFSSIKAVYVAIISGSFSFTALLPEFIILIAVIPLTILFGRFFCGFICAFGSMQDFFWFISRKLFKTKPRISEKADRLLKMFKYVLLLFIVIFIWTLGAVAFDNSLNPWNIFGMYSTISAWSNLTGLLTVGGALLLLIIVGSFFIERFFCRYICPLGAVFAVLSKLRLIRVKRATQTCGSCSFCTSKCPMGIPLYKSERIDSGECIDCFECAAVCPRSNAKATIASQDIAPLAAGLISTAAMVGLYYIGNIAIDGVETTPQISSSDTITATNGLIEGNYTDGVYTGSAQGYRGTTTVQVTVENGYITDIEVLSTDDDDQFFSRCESTVISEIITDQSSEVSAVTGATYSSDAIMNAVADALGVTFSVSDDEQTTQETPQATETPAESSAAPQETEASESTAPPSDTSTSVGYTDGVYTGSGSGYRGDTVVSVTVSGGKITSIDIVSYDDDAPYFEQASSTVTEEIISTQSVDVDAVSGATFSSNGIMEAVANALGVDFTNENSSLPNGHGGHGNR